VNKPGLSIERHANERANSGKRRYRRAKATKQGGTDVRKSDLLVVPMMQANLPQRSLRREGGDESQNCWRER
jgi:hypothetical protein